ncbi:MAG: hypothetical protein FWG93_08340, partial [Oscillospiraceae bacterium]|nr:hypothetical protein [Oscillospiraceae bacterium]
MKMTIHRVPISVLLKKGLALLLTLALLGPMLSMSPWLGVAAEPVGTIPESHIPEFIVPVIGRDAAPVIDGAIDEQEWSGAGRMVSVNSSRRIAETGGIFLDPRDLTFWITADDKNVYVAMKSEMPPDGRLITNLKPYDVSDTQVFQDDNVEIWFDPWRGAPEDLRTRDLRAFQMAINEDGGFFTASHTSWGGADGMWRPGWTVGSSTDSDWWYLELAIPFENLGITADNFDWSWGFHAGRGFKQPFQYTNIAPRGPAFADFTSMAVLNWEEENTPFVRHLNMRNPNGNVSPYVELELVNPTSSPYTFNVYINSNYLGDAFRGINGTEYVVPAGGKQSVIVQDGWSEGTYGTTIYITSADGSKVHFFRRMIWEIAPTDPRWELENKPAGQAFDFQFGYFPSYNTFKAEIDLRRLRLDEAYDEVTGAWVKITDKNTQEVIADGQFPAFTNPVAGVSVVEFDLGDGVKNIAA